jgi:hypothetical protein
MIALRSPVKATVARPGGASVVEGIVIGRTVEEAPRYDLMLADKSIVLNIPDSLIVVQGTPA